MNEEEKESIEEFRKQLRLAINIDDVTTAIRNDNAQIILNLIEKQQKEIEELKKDNNHQWEERCRLTFDIEKNFISKDKIREKIKEYKGLKEIDKMAYEEQIKPLQELLEEE